MPAQQRDYILHALTTSVCSHCLDRVPAKVIICGSSVYLQKSCPEHGDHRELLEEDAAYYLARYQYDKPGTRAQTQTAVARGCPYDCGLCPDHEQHTCIGLLEITGACDLECPVCFADAGAGPPLDLAEVDHRLDAFQRSEFGEAQVLQISGGEPTTHPQVLDIIRLAREKGIRYVMLNTNGLRLARDREFVRELGRFTGGFEIYLQFDGFEARTYRHFRGEDLTAVKRRALANLAEFGVPVTLVATVEQGVNDHEVGRLVEFAINAPGVRGINFQPVAYFGRHCPASPEGRVTLTGVLRRIEQQTGGMLRAGDFIPLPCDVDRVAVAFLYRRRGQFIPLTRDARIRNYLPLVDNTLAFYAEDLLKEAAQGLLNGTQVCACLDFLKDFLPLAPLGARALLAGDRAQYATENFFRITVTSFLDRYNFEMRAMKKECVHVLAEGGRLIPFSAYNLIHRPRERVYA